MSKLKILNPSEERSELFKNIWDEIPIIQKTEVPLSKISKVPVRRIIINVLAEGIVDANTNEKRHVMNRSEITNLVNEKSETQITLHNIHFHIKKLVEMGLVKEVIQVRKGKKLITYFTRTAKHWVYVNSDQNEIWDNVQKDLTTLIKKRHKNMENKQIQTLFKKYDEWKSYGEEKGILWYKYNYEEILREKIHTGPIYEFLSILFSFKKLGKEKLEDLISLVDLIFPEIEDAI